MGDSSRAGVSGDGAAAELGDDGRRSRGDGEKEQRDTRRAILNTAYHLLHDMDDPSQPRVEFRTARGRLDWLINHRNLCPEDVLDRGVAAGRRYPRFVLRPELMDLVHSVISLTQKILDSMAPAVLRDLDDEPTYWYFDRENVITRNLENAGSMSELHLAWSGLNTRCTAALSKYRKLRDQAEARVAGETPPTLSPLTTPGSVYRELPLIQDDGEKLRYLMGAVPSYLPSNTGRPTEQRNRFRLLRPEDIRKPPSPLLRAFPERLPEAEPEIRYYEQGVLKAYTDPTQVREPWSGNTTYENYWNPSAQAKKTISFLPKPADDPSTAGDALSHPGKKGKAREEGERAASYFGSLSRIGDLDVDDSASATLQERKKKRKSKRKHDERQSRKSTSEGGGKALRKLNPGPPHQPPGKESSASRKAPGRGGDPPDGGGDGDEDDDNSDDDSDSDDAIDLNEDDDDVAPLLPYPPTAPTVQASLKTDQVPAWDGDKSTAVEYLAMVYELANSGGHLNRAVGFWLWTKLKSGSPVWQWFMTLSDSLKAYMKRSAHKFLYVIQRDYLGPKWVKRLATEFQFHSYRELKHRHETPSQFIYRRILTARALAFAEMNSREEVRLILSAAPSSWGIVLVPSTIRSTDQLSSRVLEFEEDLMNSSKSTGGELRSQIASVLKELGSTSSASASRPSMFARRAASAFDAEVEPQAEEGGASAADDEDGVAGDMLAVAYNVVSARERQRPPSKPPFPRDNKVRSKRMPPAPCRACGSPYHWNKECPHWQAFLDRRGEGLLVEDADAEAERAYNVAYYIAEQGFERATPNPTVEQTEEGCKTQEAEEQAPVAYVVQTPSFAMTIEEIEDDYWYEGELLPADSPHVLESIYEEPEVERTGAVSEEARPALWASEQEEDRIYTLVAQALEDMPKPYDTGKVKLKPRIKSIETLKSMGASVLCVKGYLGSDREFEVMLRMDSCASISLLSGKVYDSLKQPPKLLQGAKMKLWQLTDKSVSIRGYCQMPVLIRMDGGTLVEMDVTMYVVDNMTVPVLLGEDFQQAYELSVNRSLEEGTTITFGQTEFTKTAQPLTQTAALRKEVQSVERAYVGERPTHSFLKKAARHRHQRAFKDKKKRAEVEDRTIRAARRVLIKPESVALVPVRGPFDQEGEWLVEKELLSSSRDRPFLVPNTLISSKSPAVPVANTATVPRFIQEGEALGTVSRAEESLDQPKSEDELREYQKHAAFMTTASQLAQAASEEPKATGRGRSEEKAHPKFHMPEECTYEAWKEGKRTFPMPDASSYESWKHSFSRQEEEDHAVQSEQEQVGPKTAEMPEVQDTTWEQFCKELDVGRLPEHLRERAWRMLEKRKGAFALDGKLGNHPAMARIRTQEGAHPVAVPMRGSSPAKKEVMDEQINKWFAQDVIEPSKSPWSAPVVIAYRNGKPRFCVDYRKLNELTIPDEFPIPRQQEILGSLAGAQVLSSLDALSGFTQLRLAPEDIEKTAFRTHRGLFQFKRMPFGLRNGPSIFQRVMQSVLAPYLWLFALVYIDDVVVYSRSFEEHIEHLDKVLGAVEDANITLSPSKCHLFYDSIILLGHKVSRLGLSTHYEKVKAVLEMKRPTCTSELQTFLGMLVYFNAFIPYYSDVCGPLHELLRKGVPWRWGAEQEYAFLQAKKALQRAPVLGHPMEGRPYRLYTDASDHALGCALQQVQPIAVRDLKGTTVYDKIKDAFDKHLPVPRLVSKVSNRTKDVPDPGPWGATMDETVVHIERVIAYWSRTFKGAEARYSTTEREALAAKEALVKFQPYLEGAPVLLVTDHSALQWAKTYENSNRRLASWGAIFSAYSPGLEIIHRAGRVHSNVDPLSRIPRDPPPFATPCPPDTPPLRTDSATAALREEAASRARAARAFVGLSIGECVEDAPEAYATGLRRSSRLARRGAKDEVSAQREPSDEKDEVSAQEGREDAGAAEDEQSNPRRDRETAGRESGEQEQEEADEGDELEEARRRPQYDATFTKPPALVTHISKELASRFKKAYQEEEFWKRRYDEADTLTSAWTPGRRYYKSEDGLLFFLDADYLPRLCVPEAMVDEILLRAHEDPMETAHAGLAKLWGKLYSRFYWRKMKARAEKFIKSCDACQKSKYSSFSKYGTLIPNPIPSAPYESVSMDFIISLPPSNGFDAILVVVDRLTKHAQFIPTNTGINRFEAARLFVRYVASRYGIPASIVSDRDPKWTSDFWTQVAKELRTDLLMSTSHHAQMDGQTEIVNRYLETMLRTYVSHDESLWAEYLPLLEFAYNSTVQRSTGETPFHLLMGFHPRSPMDFWSNNGKLEESAGRLPETTKFLEELKRKRDQARDSIAAAQEEQARLFNKGRRPVPEFKKGDKVLVNPHSLEWIEAEDKPKLRQRWIGPFEIQQRINPNVYRLRMDSRYPGLPIFNFEHLKKYHEGTSSVEDRRAKLPTTRPDVLPDDEYELEKIVEHRWNRRKKKREYLVRWKGFGPHYDTWQTEATLRNSPDVLAEYRRDHGL